MKKAKDKGYEAKVRDPLCCGRIDLLCLPDHIHGIIIGIIVPRLVLWLDKSCIFLRSVGNTEADGCLSLVAQTVKDEIVVEG